MTEEPFFPPAYFNPNCQCRKDQKNPMYCMTGHLTECHYPLECEEANCSHYKSEVDED